MKINMENIINEELGYMKYLLGYQRGVVISEQSKPKVSKDEQNAQLAYKDMIDGATTTFGTEEQKIIDGLNKVHNLTQLNRLLTLFSDGKTGYKSFTDMIRGEFSSGDDLNTIIKRLNQFKYNIKVGIDADKFPFLKFTPMTKPLVDVVAQPSAPAEPEKEHVENLEHWNEVVGYFTKNPDKKWKFIESGTTESNDKMYDYIELDSTDTNDTDAYVTIYGDGSVYYVKLGKGTGRAYGTWVWDGTKVTIKFKDISKNASGYVQSTDDDWSAVTENNRVIGLNAKGPLVKEVQHTLIYIGYSGNTGSPVTPDVQGCLDDVDKCDGIYGVSTKEMVKQYQKDNGLAVDGVVGQQTYDALFNG